MQVSGPQSIGISQTKRDGLLEVRGDPDKLERFAWAMIDFSDEVKLRVNSDRVTGQSSRLLDGRSETPFIHRIPLVGDLQGGPTALRSINAGV
ncbi:hypothetical protein [Aquabacterium sp. CECT 9606]|uniref:hypothetical protein n=1 Tax=Aquabacterium sp. CECT 9606 TaxID=2845822 RepID=UPI001E4E29BB|nr:hypothetical protein [Aquabacterium sp. CECT 9606]